MNNPPTPDCTFGEWLTAEMQARRWTPAELARRSGLSSVEGFLNDLETSFVVRIRLAQGLGLPEQTVHARYAEGRPLALERARAAKIQKAIACIRGLLALHAPAAKIPWQEQSILKQFKLLPPDDRVEVLAGIADSPDLREDFLAQLNALLLTPAEVNA